MFVAVSLCVCVPHVRGYVCVHGVSEIVSISLCQPSCVSRVLAEGSTLLQDLLRKHLLDNQHRLAVNLHPDPDFTNKREAQEKERLQAIAKTLSPSALDTIKQEQEVRATHAARACSILVLTLWLCGGGGMVRMTGFAGSPDHPRPAGAASHRADLGAGGPVS